MSAGISSASALINNVSSHLDKGGFGSLNLESAFSDYGLGLLIGGLSGILSHAFGVIGKSYGEMFGLSLSNKSFAGKTISKIISSEFLAEMFSAIGGVISGLACSSIMSNSFRGTRLQDIDTNDWLVSLLKFLNGF